ncbi:hypothetical protein Calkro_1360 [Caldicellulosiruptor kronotskyensis 2002]|uniref:DUF3866 domain-containing protein n=1 Tax=Caldicellulosiruptor kronotskyensis (strain DSM 18902 / VKM B-2412 / 2002) TaxID=632348 RepID=E4SBU3_CALK2|nr:DUF3866 family protein [Caldicellulosiruptor kronotskyensis]ADQ46216.1 hypothetical protein Calkro_1360 [Caldicellulosiruptor kronotskyensis 2002]
MFEIKKGIVTRKINNTGVCQYVEVKYQDGDVGIAINFLDINHEVKEGQEVLVNTTARMLQLGTGGYDYILPFEAFKNLSKGHIMKLRYTPLQFSVLTEEEKNPDLFDKVPNFNDIIVIVCELHSMLLPLCIYLKEKVKRIKISVILNDWGMLNAKLSHNLEFLKENKFVDYIITCQEAFNGEFECINEINSLIFSQSLGCDVAIISPLPGIVGTGTKFGFSSYKAVHVIEDVVRFGGRVVFPVRVSKNEKRQRHRFISHHSLTILNYVNCSVEIPIFDFEDKIFFAKIYKILNNYRAKHTVAVVNEIDKMIVEKYKSIMSTMGRSYEQDCEYFLELFATAEYVSTKLKRR